MSGTRTVAYGLNGAFVYHQVTGSVACANTVFGDPLYSVRDAGVPDGAGPLEVRQVPSTTRGGRQIMDENHDPVYFTEEDHLTVSGDLVTYQDHYTGHSFGGDGTGDQPPHVHVRPYDNPRNGQLPGVQEHYYYDPKLAGRAG